ncbi:hypothetical protein [Silvanigrella aquatica]|uniref:Lipoprotein n=1 Tax=Silvanigrella aquatica TaxID=1915309 RepID=A0A1L4D217_9BACT|nr:hypothetical protein [Silvanigrella aquatica]APJ04237.1 hypothetical protein AXG55_10090 [Silvanigrella aquatica]
MKIIGLYLSFIALFFLISCSDKDRRLTEEGARVNVVNSLNRNDCKNLGTVLTDRMVRPENHTISQCDYNFCPSNSPHCVPRYHCVPIQTSQSTHSGDEPYIINDLRNQAGEKGATHLVISQDALRNWNSNIRSQIFSGVAYSCP